MTFLQSANDTPQPMNCVWCGVDMIRAVCKWVVGRGLLRPRQWAASAWSNNSSAILISICSNFAFPVLGKEIHTIKVVFFIEGWGGGLKPLCVARRHQHRHSGWLLLTTLPRVTQKFYFGQLCANTLGLWHKSLFCLRINSAFYGGDGCASVGAIRRAETQSRREYTAHWPSCSRAGLALALAKVFAHAIEGGLLKNIFLPSWIKLLNFLNWLEILIKMIILNW